MGSERQFRRYYNLDRADKTKVYTVSCPRMNASGKICGHEMLSPIYCIKPETKEEQRWWNESCRTYEMVCEKCGGRFYVAYDIGIAELNNLEACPITAADSKDKSTRKIEAIYGIKIGE